ncbi:MAG: cytochrome b/b6 domain-containing protein [Hyphomonadaceae bacterium]
MAELGATQPQRLWDAPTRLFHWLLVLLVAFSWWSAENHRLDWHRLSGYAVIALLAFRLYWGFFGASTARFASFVRGPKAALAHVGDLRAPSAGHNALGGWSVLAILAALIAQVSLGLFAVDVDGLESGPLSHLVDFDAGRAAAEAHEIVFNVLLGLIALHVAAIAFYLLYAKRNLTGAMITGRAALPAGARARFAPAWRILPGLAIAVLLAWAISKGFKF